MTPTLDWVCWPNCIDPPPDPTEMSMALESFVVSGATEPVWRYYYYFGATRVAVREAGVLSFVFGDHLGSTTVTANSDGSLQSEMRYKPWGEVRYASGTVPTDYLYTGQRNAPEAGLYYYNARWYDSSLGRFSQADSLIPQPGSPQAWDHYAYVYNDPIIATDSTGHMIDNRETEVGHYEKNWVTFSNESGAQNWTLNDMGIVQTAAKQIGNAFIKTANYENWIAYKTGGDYSRFRSSAKNIFKRVFGNLNFLRIVSTDCDCWGQFASDNEIWIYNHASITIGGPQFIIHEIGHVFDHRYGLGPRTTLSGTYDQNRDFPHRSNKNYGGFAGPLFGWQQSAQLYPAEEFADMFIGYVYGKWSDSLPGQMRDAWMNSNMPIWVNESLLK